MVESIAIRDYVDIEVILLDTRQTRYFDILQKLEFDSIFGCKMHSIQNKLNEKKKTEKEYAKFISHVFGWLFMKTGRYK